MFVHVAILLIFNKPVMIQHVFIQTSLHHFLKISLSTLPISPLMVFPEKLLGSYRTLNIGGEGRTGVTSNRASIGPIFASTIPPFPPVSGLSSSGNTYKHEVFVRSIRNDLIL